MSTNMQRIILFPSIAILWYDYDAPKMLAVHNTKAPGKADV
jgi:hypothetical protein